MHRSHPLCTASQTALRQTDDFLVNLPSQNLNLSFSTVVASTQKPPTDLAAEHFDAQPLFESQASSGSGSQELTGAATKSRQTCVVLPSIPKSQNSDDLFDTPRQPVEFSPCPAYRAAEEVLHRVTQSSTPASPLIAIGQPDHQVGKQRPVTIEQPNLVVASIVDDNDDDDDDDDLFGPDFSNMILKPMEQGAANRSADRVPLERDADCRDPASAAVATVVPQEPSNDERNHTEPPTDPVASPVAVTGRDDGSSRGRKRTASEESSVEVVELVGDTNSQSSEDSIIVYNPESQTDIDAFFSRPPETDVYLRALAESAGVDPGARFRLNARILALQPHKPAGFDLVRLEDLLVAFCSLCRRVWQFCHFSKSTSDRPRRQRPQSQQEDHQSVTYDDGSHLLNYIDCSEEEYRDNLARLHSSETGDNFAGALTSFDRDESCGLDYSYVYVCPSCKKDGKPDVQCQLQPSFFFWLHVQHGDSCLHVMASGVHAEYFLGTRADHACRSERVWAKAKVRIERLLSAAKENPLTLGIRKSATDKEFYLENTFGVYSSRHILPW